MHLFPHFLNLHAGRPAVVIGKGPSLDAWLACGCPQPEGAVRIGVNHAGGAVACDYNVSVHDHHDMLAQPDIPGRWLTGLPQPPLNPHPERPGHTVRCLWREPRDLWFMTTFREEVLTWSREKLAHLPWLYVWSSSSQPAIHLAWYLGCTSLLLVGHDGGGGQSTATQAIPGGKSPEQDYNRFREHTYKAADTLFGTQWRHWHAPKPAGAHGVMENGSDGASNHSTPTLQHSNTPLPPEGELWKYQGIYGPGGLPGYGHSNHGQKALEWLQTQFLSVLDVGCGHNEFVKVWKATSTAYRGTGVDFACPGADVIAPATALPFADNAFELVTAFDMLEHLPEAEVMPALREMLRVARSACCFSIATAPSRILWQGQNLHPTVKPLDWWKDRIRDAGGEVPPHPEGLTEGYVFVIKP